MDQILKILHLEDNANDAELVQNYLQEGGVRFERVRVQGRDAFQMELGVGGYDLILADYSTPSLDGNEALELARKHAPEVPFIFVSGTLQEELAIELLKQGATDYVLKHRLARLVPAIRRARDEVEGRRQKEQLEQQLLQAQKMECLGTLAGGVAHDFNNILTIIQAYSSMLETQGANATEIKEIAAILRQTSERGASLVRQLLAFARKDIPEFHDIGLNDLIQDLFQMLRPTFPKSIELELDLAKELPRLWADTGQIHQALLNLCLNARDAMPSGGKLRVTTRWIPPENSSEKMDGEVQLTVSDTGCGMEEEIRKRVFDPFFTTKDKGKGTGLGLAVVYGVVQHHRGHIHVESAAGKGTRFVFTMPALHVPGESRPVDRSDASDIGGHETLLIVDDEPLLLDVLKTVLQTRGYRILTAANGELALQIFRNDPSRINLVLSDVGMPIMDGRRLFLEMKKIRPDVGVVLCSGFVDQGFRAEMMDLGVLDFLMKPYDLAQAVGTIRRQLDRASSRDKAS